jgi:UDP-N-acetylmuramoylalanine--D-glutamate ligase
MAELGGRRVLVCGAGVAGASAVRALLAEGADVALTARSEDAAVAALCAAGAEWVGAVPEVPDGVQVVIASPGLRPHDPLLRDAARRGVPVWGEVELAWRLRPPAGAPWLALTGTNGKTTTVHMLEAILRAAGLDALAVGNVGVPVIDAVREPHDVLAVELSSQQLHFAPSVRPAAGALLNLAPDHLDWHGSMAEYASAKARIWQGVVAIGNADDPAVVALPAPAGSQTRVTFTLGGPGTGQLGVRDGLLLDRAFGRPADREDGTALVPVADVRPAGRHNLANALAAAALARAHGVGADAVAAGLRAFVPDPHRNQPVLTVNGVGWVDDSKATNPHAARASLTAYPRVVWIAGGQLKGAPVDELVAEVAPRLRGVVLLGVDRSRLADALRRHAPDVPVIDVATVDDGAMTEVVHAAAGLARPGDTVLLAPAAASYDMFAGYAARGDAFAAAARGRAPGGPRA